MRGISIYKNIASNYFANHIYPIHTYYSIVVFEKRRKVPPVSLITGFDVTTRHDMRILWLHVWKCVQHTASATIENRASI